MADEPLLIVVAGGRRYAVAQHAVQSLQRIVPGQTAVALTALLGMAGADDEPYVLAVAPPGAPPASAPMLVRIHHADLRSRLPRLALPPWLVPLAHPAVVSLALDGADLVPLVDLVQLAHQTGHEPT